MPEEVKEKKVNHRPKKYNINERTQHIGCGIPPHFIEAFENFQKLSQIDMDEDLKEYCKEIEHVDWEKDGLSKQSIYLRYIITLFVDDAIEKCKLR